MRLGDGPWIRVTGPVEITYVSDAPRLPNIIIGGDLHGEFTIPLDREAMDQMLRLANEAIERVRERALGVDPGSVIDGEIERRARKETEGG